MSLGLVSTVCEAKFYRSIVENVNNHVGRYTLALLVFNTGMWSASTGEIIETFPIKRTLNPPVAFLPSSFSMMFNALAFSFAMKLPSRLDNQRTYLAVACFAIGGILGWPFALAIAIPFVIEEIFVFGKDKIKADARATWMVGRLVRLVQGGLLASLIAVGSSIRRKTNLNLRPAAACYRY